MKRKYSLAEEESIERIKMARIAEIEMEADDSMIVASGGNVSESLVRNFNYKLSDKKAKSNLLKGAAREALETN